MDKIKIGLFGIGSFGAIILKELLFNDNIDVVYVVTKTDSNDVKKLAKDNDTPIFIVDMKEKLNETLYLNLNNIDLDILLVSGFHRLLPANIINLPEKGCINIHLGQLPKWKGPISWRWAIIKGLEVFHITFMINQKALKDYY